MRMHGHAAHDDMKYVRTEKIEEWRRKDPIDRQVRRARGARASTSQALRDEVKAEIEAAVEEALRRRCPTATRRPTACSPTSPRCSRTATRPWSGFTRSRLMPTMTYLQAISDAMREEMRADERVFLMGEDIGVFGGAFKVTDGFIDEFGADARDGHAAGRVGDHRLRDRRRRRGPAPDRRDAVLRLHLLRLRPARQRRREDVLPAGAVA